MSVLPAHPGTTVLYWDRHNLYFDEEPVLGYVLGEDPLYDDLRQAERVLVPDTDRGYPVTLAAMCGGNTVTELCVLHPPVTAHAVYQWLNVVLSNEVHVAYEAATAAGCEYVTDRPLRDWQRGVRAALEGAEGDRWVAPADADWLIERFNLLRLMRRAARSEESTPLLEDEDFGVGPALSQRLRAAEAGPTRMTG